MMSSKRLEKLRRLSLGLSAVRGSSAEDGTSEIGAVNVGVQVNGKRVAAVQLTGGSKKPRLIRDKHKSLESTGVCEYPSPGTSAHARGNLQVSDPKGKRALFTPGKPPLPGRGSPKNTTPEAAVARGLKQLPAHYSVLGTLFGKLQEVYLLMRNRGHRCTFSALKPPVEAACHRRFTETHLAQLKALYPEALCLQLSNLGDTPSRTPRQTTRDWQLVVSMPLLDGEVVGPRGIAASLPATSKSRVPETPQKTAPQNPATCQAEFVRRLVAAVEAHCLVHLGRMGTELMSEVCPIKAAVASGYCLEQVPHVEGAALPTPPCTASRGSHHTTSTPGTPSTCPTTPFCRRSARRLEASPVGQGHQIPVRRLSFSGSTPMKCLPGQRAPSASSAELRRELMDCDLPISVAALQVAEEMSEARWSLECDDSAGKLRQMHASGVALKCFDIIRSLFGSRGPCALPASKVLEELARNGACSEEDAPGVLDLLISAVPGYLSTTRAVDGRGAMVRIARNADSNAARARVQSLTRGIR